MKKDREVIAFVLHPGLIFAFEMALSPSRGSFLSREQRLDGAWGRGCRQNRDVTDCIVSWETHPSNRHF